MIQPVQFAAYRRGRWYLVTVPALNTLEKIHVEQMNMAKLPNDLRQYPVDLDRLDALTGLPIVPGRHDG